MSSNLRFVSYSAGLERKPGPTVALRSLFRYVPDAHVTILGKDRFPEIQTELREPGPGGPILGRWKCFAEHLHTLPPGTLVLMFDLRDMVINSNPVPRLLEALGSKDILFFSEHQMTRQHPWCIKQAVMLARVFGEKVVTTRPEINGGLIFGRREALIELSEYLAGCAVRGAGTGISDQPLINLWAQKHPDRFALNLDHAFYCHGELVRQNRWPATHDPAASVFFHQYERTPRWKAHYFTMYTDARNLPECEIVVAHYNEDLTWLETDFPGFKRTVYSKSPDWPKVAHHNRFVQPLPNVGREAQTWLHHFATRYDSLADVTVCLQGNPHDHWKTERKNLVQMVYDIEPEHFSFTPMSGLGHGSHQRRNGAPHHNGQRAGQRSIGPDTERLWRDLMGYPPPNLWFSWYGGQFAVHRDRVHSRPQPWYAAASAMIRTYEEACVMERMWSTLFL